MKGDSRERFDRMRAAVADWWAMNSGFVILPFAGVAFCVTLYEMLHGVL